MWSYGGFAGGYVGPAAYIPGPAIPAVGFGYGYGYWGPPRPLGFYSGWFGFQNHWAGYMGWMEYSDYCVWHGWQQMLGGVSIGAGEQRNLLEGMLQREHGDMSRRELNELTERILKMNKELGAGDDGRVKEVTETTTTTITTTTSTVTQQQRYDTANDFLQLLNSSGGMGFSYEQAKQKAEDIRQGRQDTFVITHLESKATKQQAIQAPPQQMQIQSPPPVQQAQPQQPPNQIQQHVYSPQPVPQTQSFSAQNQQFALQQTVQSPYQQMQVRSPPSMPPNPPPMYSPASQQQPVQGQQQLYTSQQSQASIQSPAQQIQQPLHSMQRTQLQSVYKGGAGYNQQSSTTQYAQPYQTLNANNNNLTTNSTSTTTTTTDTVTSAMQGMSLGSPNQYQVQSTAPQQQYAPQSLGQTPVPQEQLAPQYSEAQIQSTQLQQQSQPQVTYPGYVGQQVPQMVPGTNTQQPLQQIQYAQAAMTPQQWPQSAPANTQQVMQQVPQHPSQQLYPPAQAQQHQPMPTPDQTGFQQPVSLYNQGNQHQAVQQLQPQQQSALTSQQGNPLATPSQQVQIQPAQQQLPRVRESSAGKRWLEKHRMGWGRGGK